MHARLKIDAVEAAGTAALADLLQLHPMSARVVVAVAFQIEETGINGLQQTNRHLRLTRVDGRVEVYSYLHHGSRCESIL